MSLTVEKSDGYFKSGETQKQTESQSKRKSFKVPLILTDCDDGGSTQEPAEYVSHSLLPLLDKSDVNVMPTTFSLFKCLVVNVNPTSWVGSTEPYSLCAGTAEMNSATARFYR
ncbi:hypothetical protein V6N11_077649 [Hibiscus sabdariffa]|uniref:Uncharacterized protein n=1 Tax=Hibiscus sabdariffa TaxID=183260 RepID=A0ABR2TEA6_9ROSI